MAKDSKTPPQDVFAVDDDDLTLWEQEVKDVTPLDNAPQTPKKDRLDTFVEDFDTHLTSSSKIPSKADETPYDHDPFYEDMLTADPLRVDDDTSVRSSPTLSAPTKPSAPPAAPENPFHVTENSPRLLAGWRGGVDYKTRRQLAGGKIKFTRRIDLHGFYLIEAYEQLRLFLGESRDKGHKCVLVIHGKGGRGPNDMGVIKRNIGSWLAQQEGVLAYHTAQPKHGGQGAVYVLLKKKQPST